MAVRVTREYAEVLVRARSAARTTRSYAEVLAPGQGRVRATRHYCEVLVPADTGGDVVEESATSTLSLGHVAHSSVHARLGSTSIVLASEAFVEHLSAPHCDVAITLDVDADYVLIPGKHSHDTLALSQDAIGGRIRKPFSASTLSLDDLVTYIGPRWAYADSAISLTDGARIPETHLVSITSPLALSQSVTFGGTKRLSATNQMVLSHWADTIIKIRSADSPIGLSQSATVERILTVESTIQLSQQVTLGSILLRAENTLGLSQTARYRPLPIEVDSRLLLDQDVWQSLHPASGASIIDLGQQLTVLKPIRASGTSHITAQDWVVDLDTREVTYDEVGLRQSAEVAVSQEYSAHQYLQTTHQATVAHLRVDATAAAASQAIVLTQEATLSKAAAAASQIILVQAVAGGAGRPADSGLELSQLASVVIDRSLPLASMLGVTQAAPYSLVVAGTAYRYSPFVGGSSDPSAPTPPPATLQGPLPGIQVPFQLVYPAGGDVTDAVTLAAPNLGNKDRLSFNRVQRETRGGTLIVYADPMWPKVQTLALSFSGLRQAEARALLTFMENHLGEEVGLIDWEHRYWRGVVVTPDEPVVADRANSYSASFDFQGELVPTWSPNP